MTNIIKFPKGKQYKIVTDREWKTRAYSERRARIRLAEHLRIIHDYRPSTILDIMRGE